MTKYRDVRSAADRLGLSVSQMNKMRHYGTGPEFVKFGHAVRYTDEALDAWAAKQARTCTREGVDAG